MFDKLDHTQVAEGPSPHEESVDSCRFRDLVESIEGIVWEADAATFAFTFVSEKAEPILGYRVEEWLSDPDFWSAHLHPDDRRATLEYCRAMIDEQRPHRMEYRMLAADGRVVWLHDIVTVTTEGSEPRKIRGIMVDVTERVNALAALQEQEARVRALIDAMPDFVNFKDGSGRWILANEFGRRLFGLERIDYRGRTDAELAELVPDFREGLLKCVATDEAAWRNARVTRGDEVFAERDGSVHVFDVIKVPLFEEHGERKALIVVGRDVTDRHLVEERLRMLNAELDQRVRDRTRDIEAKNRELEAFTYTASHDLKRPLRALHVLSLAVLEDHAAQIPPAAADALRRLTAEAEHMSSLVDDLLALSRSLYGEMRRERVDLSHLAQDVLSAVRARDPHRSVDAQVMDGLEAEGDPRLLRVVLENLLDNAWKYTANTANAHITVGKESRDDVGETFFVRDNGVGFDPRIAGELFEPFRRFHGQTFQGTGIGLATVSRIVTRHGGRVWGESEGAGKGATFFFTLPKQGHGNEFPQP